MSNRTWTPDVFERIFTQNADPWNFEESTYEKEKRERLLTFLPRTGAEFAVEMGCATGVTTLLLAERCRKILAIDASATALSLARTRCQHQSNIVFKEAFLPEYYPDKEAAGCNLVIISEILYFLSAEDIRILAKKTLASIRPDGIILLINWTGPTNTPCTGDDAADHFIETARSSGWAVIKAERAPSYRIDCLRHSPVSSSCD